ncbi:MAG: sulfotransferase domain-containing protein [Steroidobacteraceae bacterium]
MHEFNGPDFIIIGAMKCATTTLHEQLALQNGFFMTDKITEPSFFSDDHIYKRGIAWYHSLFSQRGKAFICGESSTNYTKLPDLPHAVERMKLHLPDVKLIYIMRQPMDRLVSHYIHDWSERKITQSIDHAVDSYPALINYGKYAMQLAPYLDAYGKEKILPVLFERLIAEPADELQRIFQFLGCTGQGHWHEDEAPRNASKDRLKKSVIRDALVDNPAAKWIRRAFIPQSIRDRVKSWYQLRERPIIGVAQKARLESIFDDDLAVLGRQLGVPLTCRSWKAIAAASPARWA